MPNTNVERVLDRLRPATAGRRKEKPGGLPQDGWLEPGIHLERLRRDYPTLPVVLLTTTDQEKGAAIIKKYESWITDERKMKLAKPDAIYMHPLPADRDVEVTSAVMDGPNSVVYDQAENRLHAQKAVLEWIVS